MFFQGTTSVDIAGQLSAIGGSSSTTIQTDLGVIITSFIGTALVIGGLATLFFMIIGGIQWITAGGDTGKVEKARSKIIQGIIGFAVLVSMYAFFLVVQYFFGINVIGGATGGGPGGGPGDGPGGGGICQPGETGTFAGDYCNGGTARMKCFAAGQGVSALPYVHWEPCSCQSGSQNPSYNFDSC